MAAADVQKAPEMPSGGFRPMIKNSARTKDLSELKFDPARHLCNEMPERVVMMKDIGFDETTGISPVAVSQPFRLFSTEAIMKMRSEVLSEKVVNACSYQSNLAPWQIRGYAAKYAPFVYDAWRSSQTLDIISKIAGVDLVTNMDFEIGHINLSVKSAAEVSAELQAFEKECQSQDQNDNKKPIVGWHNDSYPFVCVLMLSDCTNMVGGETALRTADGNVLKVRGPQMGCAVVLQGRYITHQALRALGSQERITMVTSFRPKSPSLRDDSVLSTVRGISALSDLYYEFAEYRLEILEERIRAQLKSMRASRTAGKETDTNTLKRFLDEQTRFLQETDREIVLEKDVVAGHLPEMDIPDAQIADASTSTKGPSEKRRKLR